MIYVCVTICVLDNNIRLFFILKVLDLEKKEKQYQIF